MATYKNQKNRKVLDNAKIPKGQQAVPQEILNLVPHILEDFCRLRRRLKGRQARSDRLWCSTEKKKVKFRGLKDDPFIRKIEIDMCKEEPTTLQQFTLPLERHLTTLKNHKVYTDFSKERKESVNKLLMWKKGVSGKKGGSEEAQKPKEMGNKNQEQKESMTKTTLQAKTSDKSKQSFSKPKKQDAVQNKKKRKDFSSMDFLRERRAKQQEEQTKELYNRLSTPKQSDVSVLMSTLKYSKPTLNYKASNRLLEMAQPKLKPPPNFSLEEAIKVKPAALHYKASNRILELAIPTSLPEKKPKDPYQVSEKALSATISERVAQLAFPKNRRDRAVRKNPFKVSRRALYAKASKHINKLAQPKLSPSKQAIIKFYSECSRTTCNPCYQCTYM